MSSQSSASKELRFAFGKNWSHFAKSLSEDQIRGAEHSLQEMVGSLEGKTFLDIGSGSGLFSLAAYRLGAKVFSFDYDTASVSCTDGLRLKHADPHDGRWVVAQGSALDPVYLGKLGVFDVVYAWGVLHHTGDMWTGLEYAAQRVDRNGRLFIALYNDQGFRSKVWFQVKKFYCSGCAGRIAVCSVFFPIFFLQAVLESALSGMNVFAAYKSRRGMSITHDWIDWLGGFPFQVAGAGEVCSFFKDRGFALLTLKNCPGHGNNEFVFKRALPPAGG